MLRPQAPDFNFDAERANDTPMRKRLSEPALFIQHAQASEGGYQERDHQLSDVAHAAENDAVAQSGTAAVISGVAGVLRQQDRVPSDLCPPDIRREPSEFPAAPPLEVTEVRVKSLTPTMRPSLVVELQVNQRKFG